MDWHELDLKEVLKELKTSEKGLDELEAKNRYKKYGPNTIKRIKKKSKILLFLSQFNSLLVFVLIAAALISFSIGHVIDASVIMFIVIINAIIGFIQEYKAEEIIEKLKRSLDYDVTVLRDGKHRSISSKSLVPGDIIILNEGDKVLADCRIIQNNNLRVNEAVLTGESFPVEKSLKTLSKNIVLAERVNMLYAGTSISDGNCIAVVVETGEKTEFGKLAELVQKTESEKMPLEKKLDSFSKKISVAIITLVTILFFIGVYSGISKFEMFLTSVSLAVSAIPEGLPAIIAIALAVAIKRMYKSNTLIRRLPAAETLGRATVICTDKTGTLTEEELNVDKIYSNGFYSLNSKKTKNLLQVLKIGILCNNARDEGEAILGDPTETALIKSAKRFGLLKKKETEENTRIKEYSFSSERKLMSIVRENGRIKTSYVKGAPNLVLERCTKEFVNNKIQPLTGKRRIELMEISKDMENSGLRVLGFAFRPITQIKQEQAENHMIFSGFQGMIDPPRKEVKHAVQQALNAGIEVKIITGDSALTTRAIADKIGLTGEIIEGKEFDALNEEDWHDIVKQKTIFARVTPKQKLKIIEILKEQKQTVAVTGDGVNDILALKKADIGVSMGIRGADVARDSSEIVLLDDNFASIVRAIREGRRVYDNLKKSIKFLLATNMTEIFVVVLALLLNLPLPLLPLSILWINLVTETLPALALSVEPAEDGIMKRKPEKDGLFSGIWHWIIIAGILSFISGFLVFVYAQNHYSLEVARTMAVTSIVFFEWFFVFTCKSDKSLIKTGMMNNKWLIYAVLISAALHFLAIYTPLAIAFSFVSLNLTQIGITLLGGVFSLILFEGWKINF